MPSPRWLAGLTIPVMAGAALATAAGTATADPVDNAYISQLRALGVNWDPADDAAMIGLGHTICHDLYWGFTPDQIAQDVHATWDSEHITFGDVTSVVNVARANYCSWQ